jgi:hypothetical protein
MKKKIPGVIALIIVFIISTMISVSLFRTIKTQKAEQEEAFSFSTNFSRLAREDYRSIAGGMTIEELRKNKDIKKELKKLYDLRLEKRKRYSSYWFDLLFVFGHVGLSMSLLVGAFSLASIPAFIFYRK